MDHNYSQKSFPAIEQGIRSSLAGMEAAADEMQAAQAYQNLKSQVEGFLVRYAELKEDYYKLRHTVARQANDISSLALESAGEAAPGEPQPHCFHAHEPDTVTVQNSPDFFFVRLSYGLLNIRHVVELDTNSQTLFTTQGTRNLQEADMLRLRATLNLYLAPEPPTGLSPQQRKRFDALEGELAERQLKNSGK